MDYGVSSILLEDAKNKNRNALNSILKAKTSLTLMKVSGILNTNYRSQIDVITKVLSEANKDIEVLRKDRKTLEYLTKVSSEYMFDDNFLELVKTIGTKDEEIFIRFCKIFESTLFIKRGIRYVPSVPDDISEKRDKIIDDKMKLIRTISSKA